MSTQDYCQHKPQIPGLLLIVRHGTPRRAYNVCSECAVAGARIRQFSPDQVQSPAGSFPQHWSLEKACSTGKTDRFWSREQEDLLPVTWWNVSCKRGRVSGRSCDIPRAATWACCAFYPLRLFRNWKSCAATCGTQRRCAAQSVTWILSFISAR